MKFKYVVTFILMLVPSEVFSQVVTNIDSLQKVFQKNPTDIENITLLAQAYLQVNADSSYKYAHLILKNAQNDDYDFNARAYNVLGHYYLVNNKLDSSDYYYEKAIELTKKGDLKFIQGVYTINQAQNYLNKGDIKHCVEKYKEAEKLLIENNYEDRADYFLSTVYGGLGEAYNHLGMYDVALENLFKSYKISDKLHDYFNIATTNSSIADLYYNIHNFEKCEKHNREALIYFKKIDYPLAKGIVYYGLAKNYYDLKEVKKSEQFLDSARVVIEGLQTEYYLGDIYNLYGYLNLEQNKLSESESAFTKSLHINTLAQSKIPMGNSYIGLGDLYKHQKKYILSFENYKKALQLFEEEKVPKEKKEVLEKIIDLKVSVNQTDSLDAYLDLYKKASEEYLNAEKQQAVIGHEMLYDTEIKEAKIQSQELELDKEKAIKQKIFYAIIFASALILLGLYTYLIQQRKRKLETQNTLLDLQHNLNKMELQNLNQQLNPHEFKNMLTGIAPEIQQKAPEAYKNMIRLLNLTKAGIDTNSLTESVENQLNQVEIFLNLEKEILSMPLHWQIDNQLKNTDIQIPRLLLKNLVENAIKHGFKNQKTPGTIYIKLFQNAYFLHIFVENNGKKLGEMTQNTGIGISTYQKLFESLNKKNKMDAHLTLSNVENGVRGEVKIPLEYQY